MEALPCQPKSPPRLEKPIEHPALGNVGTIIGGTARSQQAMEG